MSTLPECMMPDGTDPCKEFQKLNDENNELRSQVARLEENWRETLKINAELGKRITRLLECGKCSICDNRGDCYEICKARRALNRTRALDEKKGDA